MDKRNLFLNIGAMKTATTWLYEILKSHPNLHYTPEKELHYFSYLDGNEYVLSYENRYRRFLSMAKLLRHRKNLTPDQKNRHLNWYLKYLSDPINEEWLNNLFPISKENHYYCDASNLTCHISGKTWQYIYSNFNKIKLSYVMREPYGRLWSHLRFHYKIVTGETLENTSRDELLPFIKKYDFLDNGHYSKVLSKLFESINHDDLLLVYTDDIIHKPVETLESVYHFLNIEPLIAESTKIERKVNTSQGADIPNWIYTEFKSYTGEILEGLNKLNINYPDSWNKVYNRYS